MPCHYESNSRNTSPDVHCESIRANRPDSHLNLKAARLQNETAPEKFLIDTKNGLKNARKDPKNDPKLDRKIVSPLRQTKKFSPPIFHQILKVFHRPKFTKNKRFFHREALQGWPR